MKQEIILSCMSVLIIILSPYNLSAQQQTQQQQQERDSFGIKAGYFSGSEEAVREIYGGGITFGAEYIKWNPGNVSFGFGIDIHTNTGEPIQFGLYDPTAKTTLTLTTLTASILYQAEPTNQMSTTFPYFGGGIDLCQYKEVLEAYGDSVTWDGETVGFHAIGGIEIATAGTSRLFLEAKYSSISAEGESGAAGAEVNLGGFTLYVGIRF